jgi:hypothetical protein
MTMVCSFERRALLSVVLTAVLTGSLIGCSVKEDANPHRICASDAGACKAGFECVRGFCIKMDKLPPKTDAGSDTDGGRTDGGPLMDGAVDGGDAGDAGDAGKDASMPHEDTELGKPCDRETTNFICYFGSLELIKFGDCQAGAHACNCPNDETECKKGVWGPCEGAVYPTDETCDGHDENCNGETDEGIVAGSCSVPEQLGVCEQGESTCVMGMMACTQTGAASSEACDGLDNDCDGTNDEGTDRACYDDTQPGCTLGVDGLYSCKGLCAAGVQQCAGGKYGDCTGHVLPSAEVCDLPGGANENCDDETNEVCSCNNGDIFECYDSLPVTEGVGECHKGTQTCTGSKLGACVGQRTPEPETCANEGKNDDCDANIDEIPGRDSNCTVGSNKGRCRNGTLQCVDDELSCVTLDPVAEVCNELDDDCDGAIDNGFDFQTDVNHCGDCATKCGAGMTCCGGDCVDTQSDGNYCGGCAAANRCAPGQKCCNGQCRNVLSDVNNCRTCDNRCPGLLNLLPVCCSGTCGTVACGG